MQEINEFSNYIDDKQKFITQYYSNGKYDKDFLNNLLYEMKDKYDKTFSNKPISRVNIPQVISILTKLLFVVTIIKQMFSILFNINNEEKENINKTENIVKKDSDKVKKKVFFNEF